MWALVAYLWALRIPFGVRNIYVFVVLNHKDYLAFSKPGTYRGLGDLLVVFLGYINLGISDEYPHSYINCT